MIRNPRRKHVLYFELAKLLEAGFGIRQAIGSVLATKPGGAETAWLSAMDAGIAGGKSISDAFAESGEVGDLERSIVSAGEKGGKLAQAFRHLADYFGMLADARRDAVRAMLYPFVVLHMGVFLAVVPGALMVGKESSEVAVMALAAFLGMYALVFVAWLLVRAVLKIAPENAAVDRLLNGVPVIGKARKSMAMARFTKVYHTGLLAGISMKEIVRNSLEASYSGAMREGGRRIISRAEEGGRLGPAFLDARVFPPDFARSYSTAEEAGGLDKDLDRWARFYQDEASRGMKAVSVAVPKFLYAVILIFVAWRIISFYTSYYEMLDRIGE